MYSYKKTMLYKTASKKLEKTIDSITEPLEKIFEKFDDIFNEADCDDPGDSESSVQSDGQVTITNNHGHIVIVGKVASLKVNGKDYDISEK
jgi:hypothetical protein